MSKTIILTKEQIAESLVISKTYTKASEYLNVSYKVFKKHLIKYNMFEENRHLNINSISRENAQKLYDSGLSLRQVAKHYNVSIGGLSWIKTRSFDEAIDIIDHKNMHTDEGKHKLSLLAKERSLGGYRPHPNKGQYYKDVWFDSKWEVKVAKSLDEHGISWSRPNKGFIWNKEGNKYYPDFYIEEFDVYLDPKNDYLIKKDEEKISSAKILNNIKVIVLNVNELDWVVIKNKIESYNSSVVE